MAGFAGQSNVKSKTDDCCSLSSGERVRVRAVVKTHFKFLSYFHDTIRFQVHGEVRVYGEGESHSALLENIWLNLPDNPPPNQRQTLAVPSPLPSDGRGEGQGEVRVRWEGAVSNFEVHAEVRS
jgi:hypothetical protein